MQKCIITHLFNLCALLYFLDIPQRQLSFCLAVAFLVKGFNEYILEGPLSVTVLLKMVIFRETLKENSHLHTPNVLCQTKIKHLPGQAQKCKFLDQYEHNLFNSLGSLRRNF